MAVSPALPTDAWQTAKTWIDTDVDETERRAFGGDNDRLKEPERAALTAHPHYCRSGSVLNIPPVMGNSGFDSRCRHDIYDHTLTAG